MEALRELKLILELDFGALYHTCAFAYTKSSEPVFVTENESKGFNMREISMSFCGGFDPDALRNSLALTIGKGRPVRIDINCTIIG